LGRTLQKILVAVDYSPCSKAALDMALYLARIGGGEVDLLHVFQTPQVIPDEFRVANAASVRSLTTLLRERAQEDMEALLAAAKHQGVRVGTARLEDGDVANCILQRAEAGNYDLVVLGTHGRTGLQRVTLGSVAVA
jgi:nucleotide-binding universal stress UspA family protein